MQDMRQHMITEMWLGSVTETLCLEVQERETRVREYYPSLASYWQIRLAPPEPDLRKVSATLA